MRTIATDAERADGPRRFEQGFASRACKRLWHAARRRFTAIPDRPTPKALKALKEKYAK